MAAVLALAGAGIAGCGDDEEPEAPAADEASVADGDLTINIAEFLYAPEDVTVAAGTTVTWVNQDEARHTATADDSSFDTGTLDKGDSGEVALDEPGTYAYYCRFHAFMKATVEVE